MSTLCPVAQSVLDACLDESCGKPLMPSELRMIDAALRALASHQRKEWNPQLGPADHWQPTSHTRRELRNIADELFQAERYLAGPVNLKEQALKILSQETWSEEEEQVILRAVQALPDDCDKTSTPAEGMTLFCRKGDLLRLVAPLISGWQGIGIAAEDVYDDGDRDTQVLFYKRDDPNPYPGKPPCLALIGDVQPLAWDRKLPVHDSCPPGGCDVCQAEWPCARLALARHNPTEPTP